MEILPIAKLGRHAWGRQIEFLMTAGLLLGGACGPSSPPAPSSPTQAGQTEAPTASTESTVSEPALAPAGDPPTVRVVGKATDQGISIELESRGDGPARLLSDLLVERRQGENWQTLLSLKLRMNCDEPPPRCIELVPGATLLPPAWTTDGQCGSGDGPTPGQYRLVAQSCPPEGTVPHRVPSAVIDFRANR